MEHSTVRPIIIHGAGDSARIAALALAAAGFQPLFAPAAKSPNPRHAHGGASEASTGSEAWQSVLAISPASKTMLETLAVWAALEKPTMAVCDIAVYGSAADWRDARGLSFAPTHDDTAEQPVELLAHIVERNDLSQAIETAFNAAIVDKRILIAKAEPVAFDKTNGVVALTDGTKLTCAMMVDCARAPQIWRADMPALRHDYRMGALVAAVAAAHPHGQVATQLFLPDGPLALLPLPDPKARALIWSLPRNKADALARVPEDVFCAELEKATGGQAGTLRLATARAVQPLSLKLADRYADGHLCLMGDAVHLLHPMAGQGFNLTLRDAALLADCLHDARALGLAADGPYVLADFEQKRRNDAMMTGALTHILAGVFSGPAAAVTGPLGRLGLRLTGLWADRLPQIKKAFRAQADGRSISTQNASPRLMRGKNFKFNR